LVSTQGNRKWRIQRSGSGSLSVSGPENFKKVLRKHWKGRPGSHGLPLNSARFEEYDRLKCRVARKPAYETPGRDLPSPHHRRSVDGGGAKQK
jgi:hypothetical protein